MKHFKSYVFLIYFIFLLPFSRLQTMKRPPIGISPYFWSHESAKGVQIIVNACKIQQTIKYGGKINLIVKLIMECPFDFDSTHLQGNAKS